MATAKKTGTTRKTTTRSSTTRARTTKSASSARSSKPTATVETTPKVVELSPAAEVAQGDDEKKTVLRKGEFVDRVVAETGLKKRDVRAMADAMFNVMGEALSEGRTVAPVGSFKMRPVKQNTFDEGVVMTTKIRFQTRSDPKSTTPDTSPLAKPAE